MAKNIVVFMDGTRNKPSDARRNEHSNIYNTYRAYKSGTDGTTIAAYIRGVGTIRNEAVAAAADSVKKARRLFWQRPSKRFIRRVGRYIATRPEWLVQHFGAASVGWGVADRIEDGYRFIATHYSAGDNVYIFGFSRGAYEARSLASFVDKVGLRLRSQATGPDRRNLVGQAYAIFRGGDREALDNLEKFLQRRAHAGALAPEQRVAIHMVGVYDTVGALGAIGEQPLDRRSLTRLLERWLPRLTPRFASRLLERLMSTQSARALPPNTRYGCHAIAAHELRETFEVLLWDPPIDDTKQTLHQVLFAGAHGDVGGGYAEKHLSNQAQAWMVQESVRLAATTGPPLPEGPALGTPTADLCPHYEVTGLFALKGPRKRTVLVNPSEFDIEVLRTLELHTSLLNRLFVEDPHSSFDEGSCKTTPGSPRYSASVARAFDEIDGLLIQLHALLARPSFTPTLDKLRAQPPTWSAADWHSLVDYPADVVLERLQGSLSAVARWDPRTRYSPVPDEGLLQSIATLLAFNQKEACLDFVARVAAAPRAGPGAKHINAMRRLQPEFHKLTKTVRNPGEVHRFLDELDKALV